MERRLSSLRPASDPQPRSPWKGGFQPPPASDPHRAANGKEASSLRRASAPTRNMATILICQLLKRSNKNTPIKQHFWLQRCNQPITLGRRNYLFCGNYESAENIVIQSLLATGYSGEDHPAIPVITTHFFRHGTTLCA